MNPYYDVEKLRDEVIYLHSLWHQGPPQPPITTTTTATTHFPQPQYTSHDLRHHYPAPARTRSSFRVPSISFKKKKNKEKKQKGRDEDPEWPSPVRHDPVPSTGWAKPKTGPAPSSKVPQQEKERLAAVQMQQKACKALKEFLSKWDNDDGGDGDGGDDDDDGVWEEIQEFFVGLFLEDDELRGYYQRCSESGEFCCLVCGAIGKKNHKRFKDCAALIHHSMSILRTLKRGVHRGFGMALCKVLGWDADRLPTIVMRGQPLGLETSTPAEAEGEPNLNNLINDGDGKDGSQSYESDDKAGSLEHGGVQVEEEPTKGIDQSTDNKMAPRSHPSPPPNPNAPDLMRMMESIIAAMQQQNDSLVQQNTVALQQLDAARVSVETSQRKYMELMSSGRITTRPSSSSSTQPQEWSLESFLQHHPTKFNGKVSPDEADQWFRDMERIYNAKRCAEENMLAYTEYLLTGEASHWWSSMRSLLEGSGTHITWELFKKKFYTEYFPDSVRFAKEVEFLQLVQGGMSVSEYTDKFKHLIRFHTLTMNEEWLCRKFENGLRGDIKLLVAGLCIKEFPALVERAKVLEKIKKEVKSQQSHPLRLPVQSGQCRQQGSVSCFHCGGPHLRSACPQLVGYKRCNRCRREGHYKRDCPMARRASSQSHQAGRSQQRGGARPQAVGRVYAFSGAKATSSEEDEIVLEQVLDGDAVDA